MSYDKLFWIWKVGTCVDYLVVEAFLGWLLNWLDNIIIKEFRSKINRRNQSYNIARMLKRTFSYERKMQSSYIF